MKVYISVRYLVGYSDQLYCIRVGFVVDLWTKQDVNMKVQSKYSRYWISVLYFYTYCG